MVFNSLVFLIFLGVVLLVHHASLLWNARKWFLVMASYVFYGAWNPPFALLLMASTLIDWHLARRIGSASLPTSRKRFLVLSLLSNLGILAGFKYGNFLLTNFEWLLRQVHVAYTPPALNIVLPVGISFYTFQTLSYTIDVYRRELKPWPAFVDFALFVSFFPQLVAGPIVRAVDFLPQCTRPRRASRDQMAWGVVLLVTGLFQKVVVADAIVGPVADMVFAAPDRAGFLDAWTGTLAFSGQIFFDFAGYSTCAIGVALMLGFALPDNFRYPYASTGFSDFWRRWHISLSTWLRDYLYIPLGGNRRGPRRTQINLMLTMLLGGLWHGAAWRFVAWGGLHGAYLSGERHAQRTAELRRLAEAAWAAPVLALGTYVGVCYTWVFFRASDWRAARLMLRAMSGFAPADTLALGEGHVLSVALVTVLMLVWHWWHRDDSFEGRWQRSPAWIQVGLLTVMIVCLVLFSGNDRAFIYFQF